MIRFVKGNLLESSAQALVNTVNTVGVMGKGIALQFKEAYPNNYILYRNACKDKLVCVGSIDDSTVSVPCYHCNRYRLHRYISYRYSTIVAKDIQ